MKNINFILSLTLIFISSCQNGPQPINFGTDLCAMCRMKIMDNKFGAEVVTKRGKTFKFDSDECLMGYINTGTLKAEQKGQLLVIDYMNPENFIDAEKAFYLHSEKVPSPMGAYISAFKTMEEAQKINLNNGNLGVIVGWDAIQEIRKTH
jgi:copper chaperone NosL